MKKSHRVLIIIGILIIGWIFVRFVIGGSEDDWIKDDKGVWIKHGVPSETPEHVIEQQQIIEQAQDLYEQKKAEGMEFSSQCLGVVIDYAVDIVSVPRSVEDNMVENQCESYRSGEVTHFIELDEDGNIVRII